VSLVSLLVTFYYLPFGDSRSRLYLITSSARSRIDSGIVMPSALAVLRLTTSSNLVGCSIGRSLWVGALQYLVDEPGRSAKQIAVVRAIGGEAA
jgi:hypothetical protein